MITDFEDVSIFFDTDEFAEIVTLNGRKVKALFDRPQVQHNDGFAIITSFTPQLVCPSTEVIKSLAVQGSPVVVRKKNYTISDIQDDGTNITTIVLYESAA